MRRNILVASGLVLTGVFAIAIGTYLFTGSVDKNGPTEINASNKGATTNIKQLVNEYSTRTLEAKSASITSQQLIVTGNDDKSVTYDLPKDEFFVSIAPFVKQTHPCATHSLSVCQGEMVEEEFSVYIEDTDGNVIVDQTMKSGANGFIDLWIPRDKSFHVTIEKDGKIAESEISTYEIDDTCVSTMQLV